MKSVQMLSLDHKRDKIAVLDTLSPKIAVITLIDILPDCVCHKIYFAICSLKRLEDVAHHAA